MQRAVAGVRSMVSPFQGVRPGRGGGRCGWRCGWLRVGPRWGVAWVGVGFGVGVGSTATLRACRARWVVASSRALAVSSCLRSPAVSGQ